jgi:hypothetical protein
MRYVALQPAAEREGHEGVLATSRFFYWTRSNQNITPKDSTFTEILIPAYKRGTFYFRALRITSKPNFRREEQIHEGEDEHEYLLPATACLEALPENVSSSRSSKGSVPSDSRIANTNSIGPARRGG